MEYQLQLEYRVKSVTSEKGFTFYLIEIISTGKTTILKNPQFKMLQLKYNLQLDTIYKLPTTLKYVQGKSRTNIMIQIDNSYTNIYIDDIDIELINNTLDSQYPLRIQYDNTMKGGD